MQSFGQRFSAASQLHRSGRMREAEALYRDLLREDPGQVEVLHMLGLLVHQSGRHDEAIDLMRRALSGPRVQPLLHSNLGGVYLAAERFPEAVEQCREAVRLQPANAEFHNNLGVALRRSEQYDEAMASFREALRLDPAHIDARCNLGAVLQRLGKFPESRKLLEEAVRRTPNLARARSNLGSLLIAMDLPELAVPHLREAVRIRPNMTEAVNYLGVALRDMNQNDEAVATFRDVLRIDPAHSMARNALGHTLESMGQIEEAIREFEEALRINPDDSMAFCSLGRLVSTGHYHFSEEQASRLQHLATREDLPLDDQYRLQIALAWKLDEAGEYEPAFSHCLRSKKLRAEFHRRHGEVFDPDANRQSVDRMISASTPAWFKSVSSFGSDSEQPIFVVGMMRSGTTLTEQILSSHPRVFGAGELPDIDRLFCALPLRLGLAMDPVDCMSMLDENLARSLAGEYLNKLRLLGATSDRVVDKLPFNYQRLGFIAALFPRARIIHCRRNAVDTCMSAFFQNFKVPHVFTLDLTHLGTFFREYERLMAHWASVLPIPIFELQYEELIADQEGVSRRLVDFCGLEWHDRCLRFNETKRVVKTASSLQVRQSMYRTSVGKWQRYGAHIQPLLDALGYVGQDSDPDGRLSGL